MPSERQADLRHEAGRAWWELAQAVFTFAGVLAFGTWALVEVFTHQALTDRGIALFALSLAWGRPSRPAPIPEGKP